MVLPLVGREEYIFYVISVRLECQICGCQILAARQLLSATPLLGLRMPCSISFLPAWNLFLSAGSGDLAGIGPFSMFN